MHYKYVWRGLEEMFEFAHLHNKKGLPAMLGAFFIVEIRACLASASPFNPSQLR